MSLLSPSNSSPTAGDRADPFPPIYGGGCGRSVVRTSARKQSEGGHSLKPSYLPPRGENRRIFLNIAREHRYTSPFLQVRSDEVDVLDKITYTGLLLYHVGVVLKFFPYYFTGTGRNRLTKTTRKQRSVVSDRAEKSQPLEQR